MNLDLFACNSAVQPWTDVCNAGPETLEEDGTSQDEQAAAIQRLRSSCQAVEEAAREKALWNEHIVDQFEHSLLSRALVRCFCPQKQDMVQKASAFAKQISRF